MKRRSRPCGSELSLFHRRANCLDELVADCFGQRRLDRALLRNGDQYLEDSRLFATKVCSASPTSLVFSLPNLVEQECCRCQPHRYACVSRLPDQLQQMLLTRQLA